MDWIVAFAAGFAINARTTLLSQTMPENRPVESVTAIMSQSLMIKRSATCRRVAVSGTT
jgi:hypothetical protein